MKTGRALIVIWAVSVISISGCDFLKEKPEKQPDPNKQITEKLSAIEDRLMQIEKHQKEKPAEVKLPKPVADIIPPANRDKPESGSKPLIKVMSVNNRLKTASFMVSKPNGKTAFINDIAKGERAIISVDGHSYLFDVESVRNGKVRWSLNRRVENQS